MEGERKKRLEKWGIKEDDTPKTTIVENLSQKFSQIGLKDVDLSFLDQMTELSRGNTIQQLNMEIEFAKDDLKAGKKIFWCKGKRMIVTEDDCKAPVFGRGCANWKNGECIKP
jgi:hypothetical protein